MTIDGHGLDAPGGRQFVASRVVAWRRLRALCWKETLQIARDPSSILIALVMPMLMLFIFGFGINLDFSRLRIGLWVDDPGADAQQLAGALRASPWLDLRGFDTRAEMEQALMDSQIRGMVIVDDGFSRQLHQAGGLAKVQVITDGSEPNIARFVQGTLHGIWQGWQYGRSVDRGQPYQAEVVLEPRFWFNPTAESRNFIIPGSITVIMTVIGALLTSLVIAREWERGTMEVLLASPMTRAEFLLSKILPYYGLGMISLFMCVGVARWVLNVPFRGSFLALWVLGSLFLLSVLGMGLAISSAMRNQFNSAQAALNAAFLPAVMLSGFIYEIASMPTWLRGITHVIPARYFVTSMQTLFQFGARWDLLWPDIAMLALTASILIGVTARLNRRKME